MSLFLRKALICIFTYILSIHFIAGSCLAENKVKIQLTPAPIEIEAGSGKRFLSAILTGLIRNAEYKWTKTGPGRLTSYGDQTVGYIPPESVDKNEQVQIEVSVTFDDGTMADAIKLLEIVPPHPVVIRMNEPNILIGRLEAANVILTEFRTKEEEVERWLKTDKAYKDLAEAVLKIVDKGKFKGDTPLPLEVIEGNYRVERGYLPDKWLPPPHDIQSLKNALVQTWNERNNKNARRISEIISLNASYAVENRVSITSPAPESEVGQRVHVKGTAILEDKDQHVWVFAHMAVLTDEWWPQFEAKLGPDGNWETIAYIGVREDIGEYFEIAAAAFDQEGHSKMLEYKKESKKTGSYLPIQFPAATSNIYKVRVKKTLH